MSDPARFARISELFEDARELSGQDRSEFLERACADDPELRGEVERLLAAHERESPLDAQTPGLIAAQIAGGASLDAMPDRIGPYSVRRVIGEGGMGTVYEAARTDPDRVVALKIIKLGMDTRQVVARFEAERQALALMDHPNIAIVLDAGATETGRPYFVMELVRGEPVTDFCNEHSLSTDERLRLFVRVCRAIQHAHQKGVIHRDIKPSNILVGEHDGESVPKVIDFGIAKATGIELTEKTLVTGHGQALGTPAYMSPEQAELGGGAVDTRADIYALGVLLYELLTGTTPFDADDLLSGGYSEMLRVIREVEPERPSTRMSSLRSGAPPSSASRLTGDLDWIAMACLEKDPSDRYESAAALADDIERHLADEPISARPPTLAYTLRKYARRHRGRVAALATLATVVLLGAIGTTGGLVWALNERDKANDAAEAEREALTEAQETAERLETVSQFQASRLASLDPQEFGQRLRALIVDAAPEGEDVGASLDDINFTTVALQSLDANIFQPTIETINADFVDQPLVRALLLQTTSDTMDALGLVREALPVCEQALAIRRDQLGMRHEDTIQSMNNLSVIHANLGEYEESEALMREALEARRALSGDEHEDTVSIARNLGMVLRLQERLDEALPYYRQALDAREKMYGREDPRTLSTIQELGRLHTIRGEFEEAEPYYREALEVRRKTLGDTHPDTLDSMHATGGLLRRLGKDDEAIQFTREAYEGRRDLLGDTHPDTLASLGNLASQLTRAGRADEAIPYAAQAVESAEQALGPEHWYVAVFLGYLGTAQAKCGDFEDAERSLIESREIMVESLGPEHSRVDSTTRRMIDLYTWWDEAEPGEGHDASAEALRETLEG